MWEGDPDGGAPVAVYYRDGGPASPEDVDYLVEQLRMDGFAYTIGDAYRRVRSATHGVAWHGVVDGELVWCGPDGATLDGDVAEGVTECCLAVLPDVD